MNRRRIVSIVSEYADIKREVENGWPVITEIDWHFRLECDHQIVVRLSHVPSLKTIVECPKCAAEQDRDEGDEKPAETMSKEEYKHRMEYLKYEIEAGRYRPDIPREGDSMTPLPKEVTGGD